MIRFFKFLRKEDGAATVETLLWFPFFIAVFGLVLDVSMVFFGQAKVLRVVQDGNRTYSIGALANPSATEAYIEAALAQLDIQGNATTVRIAGVAHTQVTVPIEQLQVLGYFTALSNFNVTVTAEHMIENWET